MNQINQNKKKPISREIYEKCRVFGSGASLFNLNRWERIWKTPANNIFSLLVLAGSKTAEIEGISAAGSTKASRRYTALADAELLLKGPSGIRKWPLPPLPAGISPALISHVASGFIGLKTEVLGSGLLEIPSFPYQAIDSPFNGPAECVTTGVAMKPERVDTLMRKGFELGSNLVKPLLMSECVPGGTTTALAVLTGLGISVERFVSGSNRNPPIELKKKSVEKGLRAAALGSSPSTKELLAAVGDPFQPIAVGLLLGARQVRQPVMLGGGSQMVAVLALALATLRPSLRSDFVKDVSIGTTSWLFDESITASSKQSSFHSLIEQVETFFDVPLLGLCSGLRFHESSKQVLRDYELGFVKEGVGAGAFSLLAQINGFSCKTLLEGCELAVDQLNKNS